MIKTKRKLNIVPWYLNAITNEQMKKIALHFHLTRGQVFLRIFDFLFDNLADSEEFKKFIEIYNKSQDNKAPSRKSVHPTVDIDPEYMRKFMDIMYDFGFKARSSFLRLLVDYYYNHEVKPVSDLLPKIKADIESQGYEVELIFGALEGSILIQLAKPNVDEN